MTSFFKNLVWVLFWSFTCILLVILTAALSAFLFLIVLFLQPKISSYVLSPIFTFWPDWLIFLTQVKYAISLQCGTTFWINKQVVSGLIHECAAAMAQESCVLSLFCFEIFDALVLSWCYSPQGSHAGTSV